MYGLGIRIAFYTQWFGAIFMSHIDEVYLPPVRLLGLLLSSAAVLSLILQAIRQNLHAVEIYILLLLVTGLYMPLVPVYTVRGLTLCHPACKPLCWSEERQSYAMRNFYFVIALVVPSVGVWLFTTFLPRLEDKCLHFGFFFAKVPLENAAFIAFNAIVYISMLLICAGILLENLGFKVANWRRAKHKVRHARYVYVLLSPVWALECDLTKSKTLLLIILENSVLLLQRDSHLGLGGSRRAHH